jgi:hypothetical protein
MNFGSLNMAVMAIILIASPLVRAEIIFSQDFSSSTSLSSYTDATAPDSGQWNAISSGGSKMVISIADGALGFARSGANTGSFSRTTDFNPAPQALIYRFDLQLSAVTTAAKGAAVWQVGSGFTTANGLEPNASVNSQFALNICDKTGGYSFRDLATGTDSPAEGSSYSGKSRITWVVNDSAEPVTYLAPNSHTVTLAADQWDLWLDWVPLFSGRAPTSPDQPLTDLKFAFTGGLGTLCMDNFSIENLEVVPEPAATATLCAGFLTLLAAGSYIKRRMSNGGNRRAAKASA